MNRPGEALAEFGRSQKPLRLLSAAPENECRRLGEPL